MPANTIAADATTSWHTNHYPFKTADVGTTDIRMCDRCRK